MARADLEYQYASLEDLGAKQMLYTSYYSQLT